MKTLKPLLIVASILLSPVSFASDKHEEGEKLYKANCAVCHGGTGGMDMAKRIAPPIAAVRMHYMDAYPDQKSFVNAVSSWVGKQDPSKSLMRGAIQQFNIMPPLAVNKEDAQKIAGYIYAGNIEELVGFREHVEEEHGKQGMGQHKGMGEQEGMHSKGMHEKEDHQKGMQQQMRGMHNGMHGEAKGMGKGKRFAKKGMGGMMRRLNISPQQRAAMRPLMMQKRSTLQPLRQQMQQINQTIERLDTTSPSYKADIFSLAKKKADLVHRMVIEKGEMRMKLDAILSPAQRKTLKELEN